MTYTDLKSYNEVSFISMNKYYDLIDKSSKDHIDVKDIQNVS
jgi:uncharacterized pyridoxamine 5'-phosphate oxidase family protein